MKRETGTSASMDSASIRSLVFFGVLVAWAMTMIPNERSVNEVMHIRRIPAPGFTDSAKRFGALLSHTIGSLGMVRKGEERRRDIPDQFAAVHYGPGSSATKSDPNPGPFPVRFGDRRSDGRDGEKGWS